MPALTITAYGIASLVSFALLFATYLDGVNPASLDGGAGWYARASFWLHFLALFFAAALAARGVMALARGRPALGRAAVAAAAIVLTLWLYVDSKVYALFKVHFGRFFIEALLQEDAFAHIGVAPTTLLLGSWPLALFLLPHVLIGPLSRARLGQLGWKWTAGAAAAVVALLAADKAAYGYFYFTGAPFVFDLKNAAPVYPTPHPYYLGRFYEAVLGRERRVAFTEASAKADGEAAAAEGDFAYPAVAPRPAALRPLNVILVVAESLRAAEFNEKTAPFLSALAGTAVEATNHYSSSNTTHMGLFSLLYGLNPHYFQDARVGRVPSAPMELLALSGYDINATVSRTMHWYDIDRFVFGGRQKTFVADGADNVQRDRAVTDRAIELARGRRGSAQPYLNFLYYYATHADYQHPPETAVFQPALTGPVDFLDPRLRETPAPLLNRYRNSVRFIDGEMQRLVTALKEMGAWEDTILVFTSDHGQEFFEDGRLGHNSSLNHWQTQVPLLLHVPGLAPRRIEKLTSHTDVIGTLLAVLGAPKDFARNLQGRDMLAGETGSVYVGLAHYQRPQRFAILSGDSMVEVDLQNGAVRIDRASDLRGRPIAPPADTQRQVLGLLQQFRTFRDPTGSPGRSPIPDATAGAAK